MKLVIVESPTKARTIGQFLGKEFSVESSFGHVRDLPRSKLGVDTENNFAVQYLIPRKASPNVKKLKKEAKKAEEIILATDEDREGEAISWHLIEALVLAEKPTKRIVFHEITKSAIEEALKHPRELDMHLVNAQQARRVLDRLVGYKLSPFLWKKISGGLSAGRVQSVAVRLIAEREAEIRAFRPEEYWSVELELATEKSERFSADLAARDGVPFEKMTIQTGDEASKIAKDIEGQKGTVKKVEAKDVFKNPPPPFITSTLQQEAAKRLRFSSKKTMVLAQRLYENGHITYMRTDSVNLSEEALRAGKNWIEKNLGREYAVDAPRVFKKKSRLAQEAHEAIRPASAHFSGDDFAGDGDEKKLYDLIWRRFIASQLPRASFHAVRAEFEVAGKSGSNFSLVSNGMTLKFDGYTRIWATKFEERELPQLAERNGISIEEARPERHETQPPARYNEASLIKALETNGVGRPSTYAPTISTILARNYVEKQSGRFFMTEIGEMVNKMLTEHFPQVVDIAFTAKMEEELDQIAEGKMKWQDVIGEFYGPFSKNLATKYEEVQKEEITETTDEVCEKCAKPMTVKRGRFGKFLACSGYPECKNTKTLKDPPKSTGIICPKCGEGELLERRVNRGRARGKMFWGCSKYPACDYASWTNPSAPGSSSDTKDSEDKT